MRKYMKIAVSAPFLAKPCTGIGQVTTHVLNELSSRDEELVLFVEGNDKESFPEILKQVQDDIHKTKSNKKSEDIAFHPFLPFWKRDDLFRKLLWEKKFAHEVKKENCDIVLSLQQSSSVFPEDMHHVMIVHDIIPHIFQKYLNNFRKRRYQKCVEKGIKKASKIIAVSEATKKDLVKYLHIPEEKITVAYISVGKEFKKEISEKERKYVREKYHLPQKYIYYGGGLEMRKNVDGLLRAYKRLQEERVDIPDLVISGKLLPQLAPLVVDVEHLVSELELEESVHILGMVPGEDLPGLHANALFFVFPSHYEGFGMPVLEAMSIGTPVLTAENSSLPEVGGDAVLYCNSHFDIDIAKGMEKLLDSPELRKELSQKGKNRAKEFTWKSFVDVIMSELDE